MLKENAIRLLDSGQAASASQLIDILCEIASDNADLLVLKARCLYDLRVYDGVLRIAKSVSLESAGGSVLFLLGMKSAFEVGEVKACLAYAKALLGSDESMVIAMCYIAKCSELAGDISKSVRFYKLALDKDPFCSEAMSALIERHLVDSSEVINIIDSLGLPKEAEIYRRTLKTRVDAGHLPIDTGGIPRFLVLLNIARREYEANNLRQALSLTSEILEQEPYDRRALCLHLSILIDLKASPLVFEKAHFLSKNKSYAELAVYAIGCFYYSLSNFERAGRYFSRATELDCYFVEAWIAYGHCYAKLEEGEQALAAYRHASNFFPGYTACYRFIGMQNSRVHRWFASKSFFEEAMRKNNRDPLILNEMGVLYLHNQNLESALQCFQEAYDNLPNPDNPSEHCDCIVFNLATVLRKLGFFEAAIKYYSQYVRVRPNTSHGHCALGFAYHLAGNIKAAIACYHTAESIKPDSFCRDLLCHALKLDFGNVDPLSWEGEKQCPSQTPGDVSFSTVSRRLHSETSPAESTASPRPSVGRSLDF